MDVVFDEVRASAHGDVCSEFAVTQFSETVLNCVLVVTRHYCTHSNLTQLFLRSQHQLVPWAVHRVIIMIVCGAYLTHELRR